MDNYKSFICVKCFSSGFNIKYLELGIRYLNVFNIFLVLLELDGYIMDTISLGKWQTSSFESLDVHPMFILGVACASKQQSWEYPKMVGLSWKIL